MRRVLVRTIYAFGITAAAILCLVLLFLGFANTGFGQRIVGSLVSPLSGGRASVAGLSGRFPDALRATHIEISDKQGVWLSIDNATIDWSPLALLRKHVDVSRFEADRIAMSRLPQDDDDSQSDFQVDISALRIGRIETGAALSGKPMQLTAQGAVHYVSAKNVTADLTIARFDAPGTYRVNGRFTDGFIRGEAHIEEPPQGLIAGLLRLNEIGPIALDAQASGTPQANAIVFTLEAGALHATGKGTIDLPGSRADVDFMINAPAMTPRPDLSWGAVMLDGHMHGPFNAPDVDGRLAIRNFRAGDNAVDEITGRVQGTLGGVDFTGSVAGLKIPGIGPELLGRAPIDVKGHADLAAPTRPVTFTLSHPAIGIDGQMNLQGQRSGTAHVTLPEIAPFVALGGAELRGRATFTAQLLFEDAVSRIALDGTIDARGGQSNFAQLLGRNARVVLKADIEGANIAISEARFDAAAFSTRFSGAMRQSNLDISGTVALADLSVFVPRLKGAARIEGRAVGPLQTARLTAKATGDLSTEGFVKQQITLTIDATGLPKPSAGNFRAQGGFDGSPVSLDGTFGWETDGVKLVVNRGEWKSLNARASLVLPQKGGITGQANLNLSRLQDLAPIVGQPIEGSIDAAFTAQIGKASTVQARGSNLRFQDIRVGEATVAGQIANPTDAPVLALKFTASRAEAYSVKADASGQVDGSIKALVVHIASDVRDKDDNPAKVTAVATLDTAKKQVLLTSFSGDYRQQTATLSAPTTISYAKGISLDRLRAKIGDAAISIEGDISPALNASASVENITAEQLRPFAPQLSSGRFSATAKLTGTLTAPEGNVTLTGRELRATGTPAGIENASLDARGILKDRSMSVDATVTAGKSARVTVKGDAPLDAERKFALNADGTLDLAILTPIFAAEGRSLSGQFVVNASIGGTMSAPLVAGKAQLSGGDFQDFTRGVRIQDMRFTADSDGKTIRIADFSGRAGPGTIDGKATVDIMAPGMPVEASLEVKNARPIANDRLTATMNGRLQLSGDIKQRVKLSGAITVNRGEITLPDNLPPTVVVLDVRRRGQNGLTEVVQAKATQTDLDVTVSTPGQFFVRGRGLDAEVQGQIHIGGTDTAPNITGGFDLRRGMYALAGQTLNFTSGKVSFDGTGLRNKLDPTLDFAAQTVSGGVTATLQVTGYASQPKIQLSSMPQLPQDEILARLLFQQSAKEMSPFQLAEIAQAAASLGGVGTGFNPLGALRNRLGLDVFSVGSRTNTGGVTETTVQAGKYVSQGVFIGAKQSQSGGTQTEVQIDLTKNLKARATVDAGSNAATTQGAQQGSGNSIGLTYQFEY